MVTTMYLFYLFLHIIINATLTQSTQYYIKEGEVPSYLYRKFDNVKEEIFPSVITVEAAFSALKGTLLYSIDKNMNQLVVTMRDDIHVDTRYGLQVELNTQLIIVSLSQLCGREGSLFDERKVLKLRIMIITDKIMLMCNSGNIKMFANEKNNKLLDNYPIPYSKSKESIAYDKCVFDAMTQQEVCTCHPREPTVNEAHLWVVNHPIYGKIYSNRDQMYGCIFNVFYYDQPIIFTNMSSNIDKSCRVACSDDMCNGGECFVIYSEEPICNCTKAFGNGRLCNDTIRPMNFRTTSQIFNYKMFKLSWKSKTNSILELINRDVRILIGRKNSNLFFQYNFMDNSRKTMRVTISDEYVPNTEYICIVYFHANTTNIITYANDKWSSIWIPCVVDIRQEQMDTMILSSGDGVMDFVFKYNAETLWMSVDYIRMIELEKEPMDYRPIIISVSVTISSIVAILSVILISLFIKKKRNNHYFKRFHYYEFEGDTPERRYINQCMFDLRWDIKIFEPWKEYIIGRIPVPFLEPKLERMHEIIRNSRYHKKDWEDMAVLFIHMRLFVLPSMMMQNDNEYKVGDTRSMKFLISTIIDNKYEYELFNYEYLLDSMMELIVYFSEYYRINPGIHPLINIIMSLVSRHIVIGDYKYKGDVEFLKSYLCEDYGAAVWPALILCHLQFQDKYINIMRQYLYSESKDRLSDDAVLVYCMMMKIMSENKYTNYAFTEVEYRLLSEMYEYEYKYDWSDIRGNMSRWIGYYLLTLIHIMWRKGGMKEYIEKRFVREHQRIVINCLALFLSRHKEDDYVDLLISLLVDVHRHIPVSVVCVRITEMILYRLSRYPRRPHTREIMYYQCTSYLGTANISEEIRLSSSIIVCLHIEYINNERRDITDNIVLYLSDIIGTIGRGLSDTYLGFIHIDISRALSKIIKYRRSEHN